MASMLFKSGVKPPHSKLFQHARVGGQRFCSAKITASCRAVQERTDSGSALICRTTVMQSVPRAVATGSPPIARIEIARTVTRSLPLSVLTSSSKLGHYPLVERYETNLRNYALSLGSDC